MKTQQLYTRHHWLAVKQTIGINTAPSFLNTGWESSFTSYRKRTRNTKQDTYYIDILGLVQKLSIFFKGVTNVSFQTEWRKEEKTTTVKMAKSI